MTDFPKVNLEYLQKLSVWLSQAINTPDETGQSSLNSWLDEELEKLSNEDEVLYHYILQRGKQFSKAMVGAPEGSIEISLVLELVVMIRVLKEALSSQESLNKFSNLMNKWLNGKQIKGIDKL